MAAGDSRFRHKGGMTRMACQLRHIAISVSDLARSRKFFEHAFGLRVVGDIAGKGVYMSDGTMNVALLVREGRVQDVPFEPLYGVLHFGMWVDDMEQAKLQVRAAGATLLRGPHSAVPGYYEVKFRAPDGIVFDLTASGWPGAVKNVQPVDPLC